MQQALQRPSGPVDGQEVYPVQLPQATAQPQQAFQQPSGPVNYQEVYPVQLPPAKAQPLQALPVQMQQQDLGQVYTGVPVVGGDPDYYAAALNQWGGTFPPGC